MLSYRKWLIPALLALPIFLSTSAEARQGFSLTDSIKNQLMQAAPVKGGKIASSDLADKPTLVVFFASW